MRHLLFLLIAAFIFHQSAKSDVLYERYKNTNEMTINLLNDIKEEDVSNLKNAISDLKTYKKKLHMNAVQLNSRGGNGGVGRDLGHIIRENELNTYVAPNNLCNSACVFVLMGGVMRYPFGEVAVHRTTYLVTPTDDKYVGYVVDNDVKKVRAYVDEMGLSTNLADAILATPNWTSRQLSDDEKIRWGVSGIDRYHEDILFNKMSRDRSITRPEVAEIFRSNYANCLVEAEAFSRTVFECAETKEVLVQVKAEDKSWSEKAIDYVMKDSTTTAAWVQAIGSLLALAIVFFVAQYQHQKQLQLESQRENKKIRLYVKAGVTFGGGIHQKMTALLERTNLPNPNSFKFDFLKAELVNMVSELEQVKIFEIEDFKTLETISKIRVLGHLCIQLVEKIEEEIDHGANWIPMCQSELGDVLSNLEISVKALISSEMS